LRTISEGNFPLSSKTSESVPATLKGIDDEHKNSCQAAHFRHRSLNSFIMTLIAALKAYCFFDKKPAIRFERDKPAGQEGAEKVLFYRI
jgi:hypothetical protein